MQNFYQVALQQINSLHFIILGISAIVNLIFAGAIAKDASDYTKTVGRTHLVNGTIWAFATLVGGILVVAVYWLMHRVNLRKA